MMSRLFVLRRTQFTKVLVIAAFVGVLLAPLVFSAVSMANRRTNRTPSTTLELRLITPHQRDIRQAFARAFSAWHHERYGSDVALTFITPGGTGEIVRYLRSHYEATRLATGSLPGEATMNVGIDLVWGGGDLVERELKEYLKPVTVPASELAAAFPATTLAGVPLVDPVAANGFDPAPRWVGVALSSFGIVYNPELYATLQLDPPSTWDDLAQPSLHGLLSLADPTHSGAATMTYMMVLQSHMARAESAYWGARARKQDDPDVDPRYVAALDAGWAKGLQTLVLMGANARYFADSGGRPANDVGMADAAAGVAIDFYARVYQDSVGVQRIAYVAPRNATAVTPDTLAVLYGTTALQEELANRFVSFSLSREGQQLWATRAGTSPHLSRSLRRLPIRRDVYADRQDWADDVDPFAEVESFNLRGEWLQAFRETRLLIATIWLDAGNALQSAHERVLEITSKRVRDELRARLSQVPIERQEVYALERDRRSLEKKNGDVRLLLTRARARWAERLRQHFANVEREAVEQP